MVDLTDVPLFQDMTSMEQDGNVIDLHNNYDCTSINYEKESGSLNIVFKQSGNAQSKQSNLCLHFKNAVIVKFDFSFNSIQDARTINNFYRGRFENNGKAIEYSALKERYFYVEFESGNKLELFSQNVLLLEI